MSLSVRRAWIEMLAGIAIADTLSSLSVRRAWIEIPGISFPALTAFQPSLSVRRAWIEILNAVILRLWVCCRSP